jgi:hypothetical protein
VPKPGTPFFLPKAAISACVFAEVTKKKRMRTMQFQSETALARQANFQPGPKETSGG